MEALTWCTIFPKGPSKDVGAVAMERTGIGWYPAPPTRRSHHFKAAAPTSSPLTRKQELKGEAVLSSGQASYRDKKEVVANQRRSIVATVPDQKPTTVHTTCLEHESIMPTPELRAWFQ